MQLKRVARADHPMYQQAVALYQDSFPYHEQREASSQERILADAAYHFDLIYDEEVFVGLVLYWETENFIYIEHFCILPEMRNRQYGQRTLALLEEQGKTLLLEIDPPVDDISIRRKGFYERCGFTANGFHHVHPPYHSGCDGHPLVLMTYPRQISQDEFDAFTCFLRGIMEAQCASAHIRP